MRKRFHATVELDAVDAIGSFTDVVNEVLIHLSSRYGTAVNVTIDIEAEHQDGFDERTVRAVRENARTLKFKTAEFEEE